MNRFRGFYHLMQENKIAKDAMRKANLRFFTLLTIILLAGCNAGKEKEIPGIHIPGIRTTISRILISPLAFDGAIVAVEGLVHNLKSEQENPATKEKIFFQLVDLRGNMINVSIPGRWDIVEKDHIIVGGIYRRTPNEIEAEQLEIIPLAEGK